MSAAKAYARAVYERERAALQDRSPIGTLPLGPAPITARTAAAKAHRVGGHARPDTCADCGRAWPCPLANHRQGTGPAKRAPARPRGTAAPCASLVAIVKSADIGPAPDGPQILTLIAILSTSQEARQLWDLMLGHADGLAGLTEPEIKAYRAARVLPVKP